MLANSWTSTPSIVCDLAVFRRLSLDAFQLDLVFAELVLLQHALDPD
jgi:hypothetical protein